jgi:CubicO group peptidase (beta-lactamase class C family)
MPLGFSTPGHGESLRCVLLSLFLVLGCESDPAAPPFPETQGIDPEVLESVYSDIRSIPGSFSLLVQRNGELVAEEYFHGFTADSLHDVRSVTKSVISILVGIAIEEGFISSIDDPVGPYLAPVVDSIREEVANTSIRHFLMMSSGLDWHELDRGNSYSLWWQADDMVQHVVDLPIVHAPGARFIYNTGASHLLSVVLTQATGMPTLDFARQVLFHPMGFSGSSWLQENRGFYTGGMGLRITARDMMKIGQMFLDGGLHEGTRILPEAWVQESVSPLLPTGDVSPFGEGYGLLWWIGSGAGRDFFYANGYGGQFILVDPELNLVVVAQNSWRGTYWDEAGEQWYRVLSCLVEDLLGQVE